MIRNWYIGAGGMNAQQARLDAISNNLANADTTGFKRDIAVSREIAPRRAAFPRGAPGAADAAGAAPVVDAVVTYTDFSQGTLRPTGAQMDFALDGEGFFCVQTPEGERYTRDGEFSVGADGCLVTKGGYAVLGEDGVLNTGGKPFTVAADGVLRGAGGEVLGAFRIVRFPDVRHLKRRGDSIWSADGEPAEPYAAEDDARPRVLQGFVEGSNVNVVNEMVRMIEVNRAYEANQRAVRTEDEMAGILWSRVAQSGD